MQKTAIIVLAAGEGKRMANAENIPKPLQKIHGKSFIKHLLDSIAASGVCDKPTIVVGHGADMIKEALGEEYNYVFQAERLGTGHAVKVCRDSLAGTTENVMVFYADHPFVTLETIQALENLHTTSDATLSLMTVKLPDFDDWRSAFLSYGRVTRDEKGELLGIVENKDATEAERKITEISPGYYCFKSDWLFKNLELLKNENAQGEYYLTDLLHLAFTQNEPVASVSVDPKVAIGINSPEELAIAEEIIDKHQTLL